MVNSLIRTVMDNIVNKSQISKNSSSCYSQEHSNLTEKDEKLIRKIIYNNNSIAIETNKTLSYIDNKEKQERNISQLVKKNKKDSYTQHVRTIQRNEMITLDDLARKSTNNSNNKIEKNSVLEQNSSDIENANKYIPRVTMSYTGKKSTFNS